MKKFPHCSRNVLMIAYSDYVADARIKREAETLADNGWNVSVIMLTHKCNSNVSRLKNVVCIPIDLPKFVGNGSVGYLLSYLNFTIRAFFVCTRILLKKGIDVVHIHNMPNFLVFAALVPRLFGRKIVLDIHDSMIETYQGKFGKLPLWLYTLLYLEERISTLFVNHVVCVNHIQMQPLLKRGVAQQKLTVLLNVPDHRIFNPSVAADPVVHENKFNLVYHGTLDKALGIDLALLAVQKLRVEIPSIVFHIIGKGKDKGLIAKMIEELDLEANVDFQTSVKPVHEMPSVLHNMHIGIVPNRSNAATRFMLPVKLIEYVSLGIPVVAPTLETIRYYFNDKSINYFQPENIDDMVRAIRELCGSAQKRAEQAKNALGMLEQYGWQNHKYDLLEMYEQLVPTLNLSLSAM